MVDRIRRTLGFSTAGVDAEKRVRGGRGLIHAAPFMAGVLVLLALGGCRGHGVVHLVPSGTAKISMRKPLLVEIHPTECYYWVTDENQLCIAMRQIRHSLFGVRGRREFILSMVLEGVPASVGRNYRAGRRTMRAHRHRGLSHSRLASLVGIVSVWDFDQRKLRGRFRLSTKQQTYSVLTGWGSDRRVLVIGDFTAIKDRKAGEALLARTEERGMARDTERGPAQPRARRIHGTPRKSKP
ncbi:MAG: hypothetical protein IH987_12250 [Planctomycetes bacterium]|nr:hypothetical protein [Planctomycetota bacterium]